MSTTYVWVVVRPDNEVLGVFTDPIEAGKWAGREDEKAGTDWIDVTRHTLDAPWEDTK